MDTAENVRRPASPYARRLARDHDLPLAAVTGSGPNNRIVAADITAYLARPTAAPVPTGYTVSALGATVQIAALTQLLAAFAEADSPFSFEDLALRAAACALDDVPEASNIPGAPIALETALGQIVLADIRKGSLAPLRARRIVAIEAGLDYASKPAVCSLRLLAASDIRPLMMPLLPGRPMRLVLVAGTASAECLLSFDAANINEDVATAFLSRFKAYLEIPIRMLA
jgi:hypothetical protein